MPSVQEEVPGGRLLRTEEARPSGPLKDTGDTVTGHVGGGHRGARPLKLPHGLGRLHNEFPSKRGQEQESRNGGRSEPASLEPGRPAGVLRLGAATPEPAAAAPAHELAPRP